MAKVRVGINGFGRIGRGFVRCLADAPGTFDLVLINDLTDVGTLGHLLKHDSVHGRFPGTVTSEDGALVINGDKVTITAKKDPAEIPWKEHGVASSSSAPASSSTRPAPASTWPPPRRC